MSQVKIFDTTLRDGEQSPGASMNIEEKLLVARQLERLGVDIIEAGFPIASDGDFQAVELISREIRGCEIAGLARANKDDIDRAWEALQYAANPRIHTFIATSPIHMKFKLQKNAEEVLADAVEAVTYARTLTDNIEFSAEDATRSDIDFLCRIFAAVIEAGATTINIPDTVGYTIPEEYGAMIRTIKSRVPNIDRAVISVHCHNDLGLGTANSLAAVENGARQVECTINGIGERAGNAALEEIVMAIKTREDYFNATTDIDTTKIYPASRLVASITGMHLQRNKAIVGENAFAHEAGIHQHGILSDRRTYEIMRPEDIGLPSSRLVLGKHSGRHGFEERVKALGYKLTKAQLNEAYQKFIELADKKKDIYDADIEALIEQQASAGVEVWRLESLQTTAGTNTIPTATVTLSKEGKKVVDAATGDGPIDAAYEAIGRITGVKLKLTDYSLRALTSGKDAQGEVTIEVSHNGEKFRARGISTDIVEASAKAYLAVVNRVLSLGKTRKRKKSNTP